MANAVVLVSGGLDSAVTLALARERGFACFALTVDYRQRHRAELVAAQRVTAALGVAGHRTLEIDLSAFGGSALTDPAIAVPTETQPGIPVTYVPARNTILLSLALAWAEVLGARDIFIGANAVDYSGYPDCRPEYLHAFEAMANLATKAAIEGATLRDARRAFVQSRKKRIALPGKTKALNVPSAATAADGSGGAAQGSE